MISHIIRVCLYIWLLVFTIILLGLTGYRIHYTETLNPPGDVLTDSTHFYDPIIVELVVTSALAIIFSLWFIPAIWFRLGGPLAKLVTEAVCLLITWIMFLCGAAIMTHKWSSLKWCRGSQKVCSVLETIKAFSWMCWIILTFILVACLYKLVRNGPNAPVHGRRENGGVYPETRENPTVATGGPTTAGTATHNQPAAQPQQVIA